MKSITTMMREARRLKRSKHPPQAYVVRVEDGIYKYQGVEYQTRGEFYKAIGYDEEDVIIEDDIPNIIEVHIEYV